MQTTALDADNDITLAHAVRAENRVFVDIADDEAGEIVVGRCIHAGHLRRLAAEQRTTILPTTRRDTGDNAFDRAWIERAERNVVEKEEWARALHENVVHAVIHQVVSDRVVSARLDRDFELGADAVGTRDEDRLRYVG